MNHLHVSPTAEHPFLTLGDYFGAVAAFVTTEDGAVLRAPLAKEGLAPAAFSGAHIYSEKHGAFYHIVRLVLHGPLGNREFAVTVALADTAGKLMSI